MTSDRVRVYQRRDALPYTPDEGRYAVIDTMYFSTTMVELFEQGADRVEVTPKAYREDPDSHDPVLDDPMVCGGKNEAYTEPAEGFDLFNSPSYVANHLDVENRDVLMNSSNGGDAVHTLMEKGVDDITITAPVNAAAAADHLEGGRVHLVCAGRGHGRIAPEDVLGAELVNRHLNGTITDADRASYADELRRIGRTFYDQERYDSYDRQPPGLHAHDVERYMPVIDTSTVVPTLEDGVFTAD